MDWKPVREGVVFASSLVVLAAAAVVLYQNIVHHGAAASPQSPIRVVGGSIKLKATGGWGPPTASCGAFSSFNTPALPQTIQNCVFSTDAVDFSTLSLMGVNLTPGSLAWSPVNKTPGANWTIIAYARGLVNNKPLQRGVDICVIVGTACASSPNPGNKSYPIGIASFDNSPSVANGPARIVGQPVETGGDATLYGYRDPSYTGQPADLIEYMGRVTYTEGGMSINCNCIEGICHIYVGN